MFITAAAIAFATAAAILSSFGRKQKERSDVFIQRGAGRPGVRVPL